MTGRTEKTVFISYRRTNFYTALAVYQDLTQHGYDVFFDFQSIDSGDFEKIITENIRAKAHFLIILSPSALERCNEPGDWLRREIEMAMDGKRNIVPLMMEGFDFGSPSVKQALLGKLSTLNRYNGLRLVADYFFEAMEKLRGRYLNVALEDVALHPVSAETREAAELQQVSANEAALVKEIQLTAEEWFEQGYKYDKAKNIEEAIRCYSEAINLQPQLATAHAYRGTLYRAMGNLDDALRDCTEAIRLESTDPYFYFFRAAVYHRKDDLDKAITDYSETIRLNPDYDDVYYFRGRARYSKGDLQNALADYSEAIRLKPDDADFYLSRGIAYEDKGDLNDAVVDYDEVIRLEPDFTDAYYNRALVWEKKRDYSSAIVDYQKYIELGGGERDGDQKEVEEKIKKLRNKLTKKTSVKKKSK